MGSLGAPFILCPLSDRKELLGMAEDRLSNKVILTIGKNIAIRYHIGEQKQETSWTMSRHWLTSPVIFSPEVDKYAAVLDNNTLALWEETDTALDHVQKFKYSVPIGRLYPTRSNSKGKTLVVFCNGFITTLEEAMVGEKKARKKIASDAGFIDPQDRVIIDCAVFEDWELTLVITAPKKNGQQIQKRKSLRVHVLGREHKEMLNEFDVEPKTTEGQNMSIVGHCITCSQDSGPELVYLCEDGQLLSQSLSSKTTSSQLIGKLGKWVSVKSAVVLSPTTDGSSTIIVYGSDPSEEGAVVLLYDTKYDIIVAKQALKLYGKPPIMEVIGGNVLIPVGLHILVVALRASKSMLSGVVGKHGIRSGEEVFEQRLPFIQNQGRSAWEVDTESGQQLQAIKKPISKEKKEASELKRVKNLFPKFWELVRQASILEEEGQPQSLICSQIVPMALEKGGKDAILWILTTYSDIPELHLVSILSHLLKQLSTSNTSPTTNNNASDSAEEIEYYPSDPLIQEVLSHKADKKELEHSLSALNSDEGIKLAVYLKCRMLAIQGDTEAEGWEGLGRCVFWLMALLDAHYTRFVMGNKLSLVDSLFDVVEVGVKLLEEVEELEPYIRFTASKVDYRMCPNPKNRWRSEVLTFY